MPLTRTVNLQRQNNGGTNTTNLDPITYNSRYPGLDEYNYKKLESKVDNLGLSGYDKEKAMDEGYIQVLPLVQNNIKNSDRRKYINQARYEVSQIQDPDAKLQAKAKLSVTEISQLIKEKYNVDPSANDEEVFNSWINTIPNGGQLLANYMNNGDKELLYKGRLEDRPQGAKEKLGESFWSNTWDKMKAEASVPLDAWEKLIYRTGKDLRNFDTKVMDFFADTLPAKALLEKKLGRDLTDDQYNAIVKMAKAKNQETRDTNKRKVMDYNRMVNYDYQKGKQELDQDIANYYDNKGFTQLLKEGDIGGFFYKGLGDAAQNREMPVIIGATVVNPQMGRTLMAADSYARESEEAFETMLENGANYEQAEETAAKVGLINAAVEVYLDKILGGVETTTANAIRDSFMKNVQKEATKKSLGRVGLELLGTQLKSSGEEGLEEVVQQIVQNAAVKTVNENQGLFDNIGQAFEGGFFNPMNVFAGGSNLIENRGSIQQAAQDFNDSINSMLDNRISVNDVKNAANRVEVAPGKIGETVDSMTIKSADGDKEGVVDKISERGAEKITNTVSAQDKLYKAQEPRMNTLTKNKDLEKRRTNSDRSNELIVQNGYTPTDTTSRLQAHDATMKKIWSQVEEKINGGKEIMVDLSQISDKIDEYVQKQRRTKSTLSEADLEKLEKESAALRGQKISLPDAEALKQLYNAKINNWGDEKVSDVMANGLKEATHEIGVIEDNLLSEIPGQFQDLKNDFGALKDTYEDVFKADMKNQRRKGSGLTETYSRIEGLGDIANGMLGLLTGKGDLGSVAKGATKFLVGKSLAKASDVDFLIEQGFKGLKEEMNGNGGRILRNEMNEEGTVKEMTPEEEYQEMVNRIMTPKEVKTIVEMAWNANGLKDFYDGEYRTAEEWLKGEGSDQVEMYATNTFATQRMIESHPELLDGATSFSEVLDAYLNGTLTGKSKESIERMDLSKAEAYTPTKFYEPQELRNSEEVWQEANKRVTDSNRREVYQARGDFVIDAHNPGFVQELGLTDAEVNKKLRDWASYPAKAKDLSNKINEGVAAPYRWAGLENSSIVKSIVVSDGDLEKMVKMVEGKSTEYQRKYISNTMLALDTHIDWSPLTFNFVREGDLDYEKNGRRHGVAGNYNDQTNTINISRAGQNTVAHEMGHYLDYLWGRQLFGVNVTLSEGGSRNIEKLTPDQQKFVKHFDSFMTNLKTSGDLYNEYTMTPTEVFARFVARFTEWTKKTATNNRYDYETKWYNDKFIESDYIEFAKILQEKSKLDLANEYANYEKYLERNDQWKGEPKISEQTMSDSELRKWDRK